MTDFNELLDMVDPLIISDNNGFELYHETNVIDDETNEETDEILVSMSDSDGDGVISMAFTPESGGLTLCLNNPLFDKSISVTFYKSQMKQFLQLALTSLERNEQVEEEDLSQEEETHA